MRLRLTVPALLLLALATFTVPSLAGAAPRHNHDLTIAATPNPVIAGENVLIYGQLQGADNAGQTVQLFHHVAGSGHGFTLVGSTTTDSSGYYEFPRAEGVVYTNRSWFVRGPAGSHSRTVHELVSALVDISASTTSTDTNHPIVFTGDVTPSHAFHRVFLQQQVGSGDGWKTLTSTQLNGASAYSIAYRWRRPGEHDVRVLLRADARNIASASDPVSVNIQQAQVPGFTINSSNPIAPAGSSVTISGVLDTPGGSAPEPSTIVQLWGRTARHPHYVVLADTTTDASGGYSFTQAGLTTNTSYYVATMPLSKTKRRRTAVLYQGVQDVLTFQPSSSTATVGQTVTFNGTVIPDKAGHVIYLQRLGKDSRWHNVEVALVRHDSAYQFSWQAGSAGTYTFRARITSDGLNVGNASAPATVTVTLPPVSSLPPGS